jgi:hypothetical protein
MKMIKAQVEFVVIFSLIVIALIVIITSSRLIVVDNTNPQIIGLGEEKKLIVDSVLNSIRNIAINEIRDVYRTGAVSSPDERKVKHGTKEIKVWQDCDGINIPDIEKVLEEKLENDLKKLFEPEMEFFGKKVNFDIPKLDVDVTIQEVGIKIYVKMPTTVENSSIPQPYSIMIPSKLRKIIDTSKAIINFNNESKFFEAATLNTLLYSNPEENWLPTIDLKTECGNIIFNTEKEIGDMLEKLAIYTTTHIVYNKEVMILPDNPFYVINFSDENINVSFMYPEEWNMKDNMEIKPNPIVFYSKPIFPFSSTCIETINISYSFRYPIVVVIKDDLIDELFNFVIMVNINDNKPGCNLIKRQKISYYERCISEAECHVSINVKDKNNLSINNAIITLGNCYLGRTNYLGSLEAVAPCMIGELSVYKEGYGEYRKLVKTSSLKDYSIILEKEPQETIIHFYGVPIKHGELITEGKYKDYEVSGQPKEIGLFGEDYFLMVYMRPYGGNNIILSNVGPEGFIPETRSFIRKDLFSVFGIVMNNKGNMVGFIETSYLSDGNENELYIYLPVVEDIYSSLDPNEIDKIKVAFSKCNINVINKNLQNVHVPCD